jgi:long-chain acyl-CoA synthetase
MPDKDFDNIRDLLESRVARHADKGFIFSESDGRILTYAGFDDYVNRAADLLVRLGAKKGDRVSLYLTNSVEYLTFYFACFKTGLWAGPINAHLKSHEIEFIIDYSGSVIAITQPDLYPKLAEAKKNLPSLRHVVLVGDEECVGEFGIVDGGTPDDVSQFHLFTPSPLHPLSHSPALHLSRPPVAPDEEAVIIYTSGTTGKPKGVLLTHCNLISNAEEIARWLHLTEDDRALMIMPLFHVNALMTTCMAALWAGGSLVLAPRFSASRHWNMIADYEVTYFGSVATMLALLNQTYPDGIPSGLDTSKLRFALCGSAPVPVEVMKRFESLFNCPVIEGYGLSESTCRSTFNPPDHRRRAGSVGLPIGNDMKVFSDSDSELPVGEIGEIVLRGSNIMKGYYRNKEATEKAMRSGWFHTGDLGFKDEDGFFYVVDRKSDMIIRGGENIYPREIDETLYQHPKVKDAATVGIPNQLYGEEVKSFIVLKAGESATEQEIMDFCRQHIADYKCPKSIEFLDDIPKGPTGKLLKRELTGK